MARATIGAAAAAALCLLASSTSAQVRLEPDADTDPRLVMAVAAELAASGATLSRESEAAPIRLAIHPAGQHRVSVAIRRLDDDARTVPVDTADLEVAALTIASLVADDPGPSRRSTRPPPAPAARGLSDPEVAPSAPEPSRCEPRLPVRDRRSFLLEIGGSTGVIINGAELAAGGFIAPRLALRGHARMTHLWITDQLMGQVALSLAWVDDTEGDRFEAGGDFGLLIHDLRGNGQAELGFSHAAFVGVTGPVTESLRFGARLYATVMHVVDQYAPGGLLSLLFEVAP